jgi:uncharacterized protein (TIRG00374 family)
MIQNLIWPVLLLGAVVWTFLGYDFSRAAKAFVHVNWVLAGLAFCLNIAMLYFRVLKWSVVLRPLIRPMPFNILCLCAFSGYLCNMIFPARVGSLVQSWMAGRRTCLGMGPALGSIVVIRLLDGMMLIILALAVFLLAPFSRQEGFFQGQMGMALAITGIFLLAAVVGLVVLVQNKTMGKKVTTWVLKFLPGRFRQKGSHAISGFNQGFAILNHPGALVAVSMMSFLFWGLAGGAVFLLLRAFHPEIPGFFPALVLLLAQVFSMAVPAPANVGPYHGATVGVLAVYGIPLESALMTAVAMHGIMVAANVLPGLVYTGFDRTRILDIYQDIAKGEPID